jgi:hypothetical protein
MTTLWKTLAVTTVTVVALSGCSVVDKDLRDAKACEGLSLVGPATSETFEDEVRELALSHASARLGRDLYELSNLRTKLNQGTVVPSPGVMRQIEQLNTAILVRCSEVGQVGTGQPTDSGSTTPEEGTNSSETPSQEGDPQTSGDDGGFSTEGVNLRIEPEDRSGYDRDLFDHWIDADGDGCDTRRAALIEESITPVQVGAGCNITGGTWVSIYDGFTSTNPSDFDVDHVVPLSEAWASGASTWDDNMRRDFANDLSFSDTLIVVSASSNRSKSDGDPARWMPPNATFHCDYIAVWLQIKSQWDLSADEAEARAIESVLAGC